MPPHVGAVGIRTTTCWGEARSRHKVSGVAYPQNRPRELPRLHTSFPQVFPQALCRIERSRTMRRIFGSGRGSFGTVCYRLLRSDAPLNRPRGFRWRPPWCARLWSQASHSLVPRWAELEGEISPRDPARQRAYLLPHRCQRSISHRRDPSVRRLQGGHQQRSPTRRTESRSAGPCVRGDRSPVVVSSRGEDARSAGDVASP